MPAEMNCPVFNGDMRSRSLLSYYSPRPYSVGPDCNAAETLINQRLPEYTTDSKSKRRQTPIAVLGVVALGRTAAPGSSGTGVAGECFGVSVADTASAAGRSGTSVAA